MATQTINVRLKRKNLEDLRGFDKTRKAKVNRRAWAKVDDVLDEEELGIDVSKLSEYNVHAGEDGLEVEFQNKKCFYDDFSAAMRWASFGMGEYRVHESKYIKDCFHLHEVGVNVRYAHVSKNDDGEWMAYRHTNIYEEE